MPPGTTPPFIIRYSASNVPILQVALESDSLSEQQLFDYGTNFIRADFATIQGAQLPWPYGGKQRQIMIDIDPPRLFALGPVAARREQRRRRCRTSSCPTGTAKIGAQRVPDRPELEPRAASSEIAGLARSRRCAARPCTCATWPTCATATRRRRTWSTSRARSPCSCRSSSRGARARSTSWRASATMLPTTLARAAQGAKVTLALRPVGLRARRGQGVVKEAGIAAGLTALMILVFLGSWRSTLIVVVSIPLSILVSIIILSALGADAQRDDPRRDGARRRHPGRRRHGGDREHPPQHGAAKAHHPRHPRRRRRDRDARVRLDASASASCSCRCVFITGAAQVALRSPGDGRRLRHAHFVLPVAHAGAHHDALSAAGRGGALREGHHGPTPRRFAARFFARVRARLRRLRRLYGRLARAGAGAPRRLVTRLPRVRRRARSCSSRWSGATSSRPSTRGSIKLHMRGPPGTRIEETERRFAAIEDDIRTVIPQREIETMLDNVGIPYSGLNLSLSEGALISPADGADLHRAQGGPRAPRRVRAQAAPKLAQRLPRQTFFFLAPDISTQVLNFGLAVAHRRAGRWARPATRRRPTPSRSESRDAHARHPRRRRRAPRPGAEQPELRIDVDRTWPAARAHAARRGERPPGLAVVERDRCRRATGSTSAASSTSSRSRRRSARSTRSTRWTRRPSHRRRSPQLLSTSASLVAHHRARQHHALQRRADLRRAGQRRRDRPGQRRRWRAEGRRRAVAVVSARHHGTHQGAGREHGVVVPRAGLRADLRHRARVPAHGRQLPVVARSARHPHGAAGRPRGHRVDALPLPHHTERAGPDGRHHVRRRGHGKQHPRRDLRQRSAQSGPRRHHGRARRRE